MTRTAARHYKTGTVRSPHPPGSCEHRPRRDTKSTPSSQSMETEAIPPASVPGATAETGQDQHSTKQCRQQQDNGHPRGSTRPSTANSRRCNSQDVRFA